MRNLIPLIPYAVFLLIWAGGRFAVRRIEARARAVDDAETLAYRAREAARRAEMRGR